MTRKNRKPLRYPTPTPRASLSIQHGIGPRSLISALGVRIRVRIRVGWDARPRSIESIGDAPTAWSWIERESATQEIFIAVSSNDQRAWPHAIHEAIHVVLGQRSLNDEFGMMAVEWAICQELAEPWYTEWRENFSCYGLDWSSGDLFNSVIGECDDFLSSDEWIDVLLEAERHGWFVEDRPIWGMGVHGSMGRMHPRTRRAPLSEHVE